MGIKKLKYYENYVYQFHYEGTVLSEPLQFDSRTRETERFRIPVVLIDVK
jgi:hypothetical protein